MRKYSLYFVILLMMLFIPFGVNAITYVDNADKVHDLEEYKKYPYVIDNYDVTVNVTRDNKYLVTEKFTAYYYGHSAVYGLRRIIPLTNNITTFDGTKKTQEVKIYDVKVEDQVFKSYEDKEGNLVIDIGDQNKRVTGEITYIVSYTYDVGRDLQEYYDEFYFDLIPYSFETAIGSVTFSVVFPKSINTKFIRLSAKDHSATNNSDLKYVVNDDKTKIEGYFNGILRHNQGINIRIELDDCYFETKNIDFNVWNYVLTFLPVLFAIIGFVIWYLFGREERTTGDVQYYPPEGFDSLEVGFLFRTEATERDVLSLLIYLANKEYITIEEKEYVENELRTKGFVVKKNKEYDGPSEIEKKFLNALFDGRDIVTNREINRKFYLMTQEVKKEINRNQHSLVEKNTFIKRLVIGIFVVISFGIITIPPMLAYHEEYLLTYLLTTFGFSAMFMMVFGPFDSSSAQKEFRAQILYRLAGLILGVFMGLLPLYYSLLHCLVDQPLYYIGYIVGIVCIFVMCLFIAYMSRRTTYGAETYNKIKGLKHFMEQGNTAVIDKLLKENSNYCYDLLPYAYVLGVTKVWISKFEDKPVLRPFWFESMRRFSVIEFGDYIEKQLINEEKRLLDYRDKVEIELPKETSEIEEPKKKKKKKKKNK